MAAIQKLNLRVNGRPVSAEVAPDRILLDFIRDDLGLKGTKEGCGQGECGACTVILNGKAVDSCLIPAIAADGGELLTIEGLSAGGQLDPLQEAFIREGAVQCGYCTPGMLMSAKALLMQKGKPGEDEIRQAIAGNLCRCTGYQKIVRAVQVATGQAEPVKVDESPDCQFAVVGKKVSRRDTLDKALGKPIYVGDMDLPGMLHAKVFRSDRPHARIKAIDTAAAAKAPGVVAVLTHRDVPGLNRYGLVYQDQPVLCDDKVRYIGDAVALVVAETERQAAAALDLIKVDYADLIPLFDAFEALKEGAPLVHEELGTNLKQHTKVRKGDVAAGFAQSAVIVENTYYPSRVEHAYLETECCLAAADHHGDLTVWTSTQYVYRDRRQIAASLNIPTNKVRVIQAVTGGGFGGKDEIKGEILAGLAALKTGRPVRIRYTREESICVTTKRHPCVITCRTGADKDGKLLALEGTIYSDTGPCTNLGVYVIKKVGLHMGGPYFIPNIKVDTYTVFTNNVPSGAMRGFGVVQAALVHEQQLDMLAEKLGIDPWEIRYKNALAPGLSTATGHVLPHSVGIKATLARVKEYLDAHPLDKGVS